MVTKSSEMKTEIRENMHGGSGAAQLSMLVDGKNLPPNIKLTSLLRFPKGCSVGVHKHVGECEIYHILEGKATVTDNGETKYLEAGDTLVTYDGETHSIQNDQDKELVFMAFIVLG